MNTTDTLYSNLGKATLKARTGEREITERSAKRQISNLVAMGWVRTNHWGW